MTLPDDDIPPEARCPDCNAHVDVVHKIITHEPHCPVVLSLDTSSEDDRRWFEDHPGEDRRWRPLCYADRSQAARRSWPTAWKSCRSSRDSAPDCSATCRS